MDDFNTYEYAVAQKSEGKWKLRRTLMLLAYVLFVAAYFLVIVITKFFPLGALIPVALWILIHFTWRYVNPDYKYTIEKGTMTFYVVYGNKKKNLKATMSLRVSAAEAIAPREEIEKRAADIPQIKVYSALHTASAPDQYGVLYKKENGRYAVFYFVATAQALKLLRFYNSKTVVTATAI